LIVISTAAGAQSIKVKEEKPGLAAKAKISADSAKKLALAQVPGGKLAAAEIEEEHGKLVYSFDIKVAGKSGIDEVQIDAISGAFVAREHESPADEAKEKSAEKKAAAKKKP
jgi:uncharacterized membrane protein YkoI